MEQHKQANIIGQQIGIFKVLSECDFKSNDGHKMFHVKCVCCGWETDSQMRSIDKTKQCKHLNAIGNYRNYNSFKWKNKRIGVIFHGMVERCFNPNKRSYRWYGEKGIRVYEDWIDSPYLFEKWAMENGYTDDLTIDRIDENKDYCPSNCRWISLEANSKYKSNTVVTEVDGIKHTGREWAKILLLGTNTINKMLRKYPQNQVKDFIRLRLKDKTKKRKIKQTWMEVYGLDIL